MSEIVKMPELGLDMQEGTFVNWLKQVGDEVQSGEVIAEVEADKATIEIEAPFSGILVEKLAEAGDAIFAGMALARMRLPGEEELPPPSPPPGPARRDPEVPSVRATTEHVAEAEALPARVPVEPVADSEYPDGVKASPLARRMAEERGIDLRLVKGSGPGGRIVKADVEAFEPGKVAIPEPAASAKPAAPARIAPAHAAPIGPDIEEIPLTRMRQRIAARTIESKQNVPHFYLTIEVDMAPALELRKQINAGLPDDQKVTVNDLVIKAAALALRQYPNLNSHFYGDKVVRYKHINIGIAVALENGGLINVVAKDADITSISRLAQRNKEIIAAARSGKMRPEDLEGSTFTVSNLGPYDVEHFEAIINPPEAAILAVSTARQVPVVVEGEIKIGTRMKASLSVDHRVSDGAEGALFMKMFRELLEAPMRLLL